MPGGSDLLYVSDTVTSNVYVFFLSKGRTVQTLTGFTDPAGECVDSNGDVFIANTGGSNILEYAHGGTAPIAVLKDPGYFPVGCSIDPTSGNLAVTNLSTSSSTKGDVVIYKSAKGRARGHYTDPAFNEMVLCGYDDAGNLFLDGLSHGSALEFADSLAGAKSSSASRSTGVSRAAAAFSGTGSTSRSAISRRIPFMSFRLRERAGQRLGNFIAWSGYGFSNSG